MKNSILQNGVFFWSSKLIRFKKFTCVYWMSNGIASCRICLTYCNIWKSNGMQFICEINFERGSAPIYSNWYRYFTRVWLFLKWFRDILCLKFTFGIVIFFAYCKYGYWGKNWSHMSILIEIVFNQMHVLRYISIIASSMNETNNLGFCMKFNNIW